MRKELIRYLAGISLGIFIMTLGRYKIHWYQVIMTAGLILGMVIDLLNQKSK